MFHRKKFKNDVIIAGDDGKIYHLTHKQLGEYQMSKEEVCSADFQVVRELLGNGTVAAAIPTPDAKKSDSSPVAIFTCYLLNLASLKRHQKYERKAE